MTGDYEEKRLGRELEIAKARRKKFLKRVIWIVAAVFVVAGVLWALIRYQKSLSAKMPGVFMPSQGQEHISLDTLFSYNSNPPTSGPHNVNPAEWRVYKEEIADQILIHNLEHGGVWISYRSGVDEAVLKKLEDIATAFGRKVIMTPRQANDSDIALAAWTRLDKFSAAEFSEERVREFIRAYRNKGPEFVP